MSPRSVNEMLEEVSDFLLSDVSSPTPADLVHPTNEWTPLDEKVFEFAWELFGKNKQDLRENVAKLFPGMTQQQVQEHFACRLSVNMLEKMEKEKTSEWRTGRWSENEKWLFMTGLLEHGWSNWKNISSKIGTRCPEQVRSFSRRLLTKLLSKQDNQSLPPETNRPIANPGNLPFQGTVVYVAVPIMQPRASNMPPPVSRDLPSLRPEHGLDDIYGNFGGSVCYPSWNLRAETGANPSSRISDQVWNSTNTLSSDSYGCLPGPSAYGNNMNPGQ